MPWQSRKYFENLWGLPRRPFGAPRNDGIVEYIEKGTPFGVPCFHLAAGAIAAVAAQICAASAVVVAAAAAAEQNYQNDDPPNTITVTHNPYLRIQDLSSKLIPWYSTATKRCSGLYECYSLEITMEYSPNEVHRLMRGD